mmetsp:Transcript_33423/g.49829  ORF Transcript_33423/g.49829 Transcript_33423/m.49829 type:complete len:357 (-) Transcript_33423:642-1712(-)
MWWQKSQEKQKRQWVATVAPREMMSFYIMMLLILGVSQCFYVAGFSTPSSSFSGTFRREIGQKHHMVVKQMDALTETEKSRSSISPVTEAVNNGETEEKIKAATELMKEYGEGSLGGPFIQRVSELLLFLSEYDHTVVPKRYAPNPTLGNWVNKQRQQYRLRKQTGKSTLTPKRIHVLDAVGFEWTPNPGGAAHERSDQVWIANWELLKQFKERHGHCRVPSSTKLGRWTVLQRMNYKSQLQSEQGSTSGSRLTKQRIDMLNSLEFEWSSKWDDIWNKRISQLIEFRDIHGHCVVPIHYRENLQLANWVSTQRKNYRRRAKGKKCALTEDRIRQLDELGFVWNYWENEMHKWGDDD